MTAGGPLETKRNSYFVGFAEEIGQRSRGPPGESPISHSPAVGTSFPTSVGCCEEPCSHSPLAETVCHAQTTPLFERGAERGLCVYGLADS